MVLDNQYYTVLFQINHPDTNYFVNLKQYTTKKTNKSIFNTITVHLEDDNNKEVNFNSETLTFTLQMIKIWTNMFTQNYLSNKWTLKNSNQIVIALEENTDLVQKISLVR